jgi:hypothetical protein
MPALQKAPHVSKKWPSSWGIMTATGAVRPEHAGQHGHFHRQMNSQDAIRQRWSDNDPSYRVWKPDY